MKTKHDSNPGVTIPQALEPSFACIGSADLRKVVERLKKDHPFWSLAKIEKLIQQYRKFLALVLLSDKEIPMCNELVDEVWHTHLLFTKDYADFCEKAFGGFLHHEPAGGQGGADTTSADFFTEHQKVFGHQPDAIWFGPRWARLLQRMHVPLKLCTASGKACICCASGPAKLCTSTGELTTA